jgi:hypothetical protein
MSKAIPRRFFDQHVSRIEEGELVKLNRRVVPQLPLKEGMIAEKFSLFVDWKRRSSPISFKGLYYHGRVLFENFRFGDRYGNVYNYLALKGIGMPKKSDKGMLYGSPVYFDKPNDDNVYGLDRSFNSLSDWHYSNEFLRSGIRTTVPVALVRLKSILTKDGEEKSVQRAARDGDIPATTEYDGRKKFVPYLYLKGFSEIVRMVDVRPNGYRRVASAMGLSVPMYAQLWTKEVARNIALMHNLGLAHNYIWCHNLTVDGCLVDLDSVSKGGPLDIVGDMRDSFEAIELSKLKGAHNHDFLEAYFRNRKGIPKEEKKELIDWLLFTEVRKEAEKLVGLARR